MTPVTLLLVLASAAIHATWNLWAKQIGDRAKSPTLMWTLTALSTMFYAPFALVMLVRSGAHLTPLALGRSPGAA